MVRRGSTGDSSSNDFSDAGGGSDTTADSGVTGDSGDDTSFGGGGGGTDDDDFGGGDPGGSTGETGGGGGADDDDDDRRTTYSGGGSSTTAGSGVTGDSGADTTFEGSTGTFETTEEVVSETDTSAGSGVTGSDDPQTQTDTELETTIDDSDGRGGIGVTRGPEGTEVVEPDRGELRSETFGPDTVLRDPGEAGTATRGETRAAVNRFGQQQLGQVRRQRLGGIQTKPNNELTESVSDPGIDKSGGLLSAEQERKLARQTGLDFAFDTAFGGQFAEQFSPAGGDEVDISGPQVDLLRARRGQQPVRPGSPGELNTDITDQLTQGEGLISDQQEQQIQQDIQARQRALSFGEEVSQVATDVTGSRQVGEFVAPLGNLPAGAAAATGGVALTTDLAAEVATNLPETVREEGARDTAEAVAETGGRTVGSVAESAEENPARFAGQIAASAVGGAAAGKALGAGARFTRDRVRTAGATTFDISEGDVVNQDTGRLFDPTTDAADVDPAEARFPGAQDPDLYQSDPAAAVRQQAVEFTPEDVEQRFAEQGVDEGVVLKKALDVEPEGPGARRAGGLRTQEGSFESPGGFVGPELSPNFLRLGARRSSFSLKPGIPDLGDDATGVLVKTDVGAPEAENLDAFSRELLDREGETTARTKPASAANPGEIEAVIPPESEFADIGGSTLRNTARRLGVGSDFAVRFGGRDVPGTDITLGGRKVPLRPVADPDAVDSGLTQRTFGDFLASDRGQLGADADSGPRTQTLSEIREPIQPANDRPVPLFPSGAPTNSTAGSVAPTAEIPPTEPVPTSEEVGLESPADAKRARSSPMLEDSAAEDLMASPTGSRTTSTPESASPRSALPSERPTSSRISPPNVDSERLFASPESSGGGASSGNVSGASRGVESPPSEPSAPSAPSEPAPSTSPPDTPASPPSSPGAPGSPGTVVPSPPQSPISTPGDPQTPPRRIKSPEPESDSDREKREQPVFEEQFFRAVGTAQSLVLGTDAPGAENFSPPEAEFNTEPEPTEESLPRLGTEDLPTGRDIENSLF